MLKSLATLVKVYKAQLDERRKQLNILLDNKKRKIDEIKWLEESIRIEEENLHKLDEDFRPMFLHYISGVRIKEGILLSEIDILNPQINKITDEIAVIFSEMKKYEIVKQNRESEIALELQRKAQMEIDEMAIMNFVRKSDYEFYQ
jgi:hypothetical protein